MSPKGEASVAGAVPIRVEWQSQGAGWCCWLLCGFALTQGSACVGIVDVWSQADNFCRDNGSRAHGGSAVPWVCGAVPWSGAGALAQWGWAAACIQDGVFGLQKG